MGGVPTHRDHPWERDARSGRAGGSPIDVPPSREVQTTGVARARVAHGVAATPRATWRVPITLAIVAVLAIAGMARLAPADPQTRGMGGAPPAGLPAANAPAGNLPTAELPARTRALSAGSLSKLHSRFVGRAALEVWGRTTAPDGSSVRMRVKAAGMPSTRVPEVPAVAGRFYAKVALPPALQGRRVSISARLAP
jgi:hypothetical protein